MLPAVLSFACAAVATPSARELDVILYGAYGCVGHLAALHLANVSGLRWAIAGRNATKLAALAQRLKAAGGASSEPEVLVAPLTGNMSWVARTRAVATAAGPFSIHEGENLLRECVEQGVDYADTSDEFYWQRRMIERYDDKAARSGARVALSAGFCAVAADLGSDLALGGVARPQGGGGVVHVDAWLERYSGGVSAGVIHTEHVNASYPKAWDADPYVLVPDAPTPLRVDTKVEGMSLPSVVAHEGVVVPNLFGPFDARLMRRSFVRRGQAVALRVGATPTLYTSWAAFLARHPGSWKSLTTCPTPALLEGGYWRYKFRASRGGSSATYVLSGEGDPGYHTTGQALAEVALCMAGRSGVPHCRGTTGGVLSPGLAVNATALRARLQAIGLLRVSEAADASHEPMRAADAEGWAARAIEDAMVEIATPGLVGASGAHDLPRGRTALVQSLLRHAGAPRGP